MEEATYVPHRKEKKCRREHSDGPPVCFCAQGDVCPVSEAELESLLSCIRELLPDLGEGFLLACLRQYGYDSELVINNILEGRLAPDLDALDRAMPR